jgi:hypothetical protein
MAKKSASLLKHMSFPECTKHCTFYALTRNTGECKQVCSKVKEITEASIKLVDLKESLMV